MALPASADLHVNAPLTSMSVAYIQNAKNFVADKVFPLVPSEKQSDLYYIYDINDFTRIEVQERGPATESAGGGFRLSTSSFFCKEYAVHKDIADQHKVNQDKVLDLERSSTAYVTQQLLMQLDSLWASNFFVTGVWTGADLDGVTGVPGANQFKRWDEAGSTPVEDIDLYREQIAEKTGFLPNVLTLGPKVYASLKNHADILDRIKYTERGNVTADILASLFDLEKVVIARSIKNSGVEGNATQTKAYILGKHALLCYAAEAPGVETPSAGYCFAWTGMFGSGGFGNRIRQIRMDLKKADRIEGEMAVDMKIVGADLGVFFENAVS
jgi:hypothetical protein